ncbi:hypothetical protein AEM00_04540, partial [Lactobacillus crispatus]
MSIAYEKIKVDVSTFTFLLRGVFQTPLFLIKRVFNMSTLIVNLISSCIYSAAIVISFAFAIMVLRFLSHRAKLLLNLTFDENGVRAQAIVGFLGIVVHEASHYLANKIFGHQVLKVILWRMPKKNDNNLRLGEVDSSFDLNSTYQKLGNAFVGIAPIFGCTIILLIIMKIIFPNLILSSVNIANLLVNEQGNINFHNLDLAIIKMISSVQTSPLRFWQLVLLLVAMISISLGFDLSDADLENKWTSIRYSFIILGLLIFGFMSFGKSVFIKFWIFKIGAYCLMLLIICTICLLLTNLILYAIRTN